MSSNIEEIERKIKADPDNEDLRIALIMEKQRLGDKEILKAPFRDRVVWQRWDKFPQIQEMVIKYIASFVQNPEDWEYKGSMLFSAENTRRELPVETPFPGSYIVQEKSVTTVITHRIGQFLHRPSCAIFNLLPAGFIKYPNNKLHTFYPMLVAQKLITKQEYFNISGIKSEGDNHHTQQCRSLEYTKHWCSYAGLELSTREEQDYQARAGARTPYYWGTPNTFGGSPQKPKNSSWNSFGLKQLHEIQELSLNSYLFGDEIWALRPIKRIQID